MALEIIKKKKAVITILGMAGGGGKGEYFFEKTPKDKKEYHNTLPLLIEKYGDEYSIVPIYTKEAKESNKKVLEKSGINDYVFDENYLIKDSKDFKSLFSLLNKSTKEFGKIIVDVSHGFRHLPILMTVNLIIHNFQDMSKIEKILFAKDANESNSYEIIDLKEYLDLANIAFILTSFENNFTVTSHIKSDKYSDLIDALNAFSGDIMALNLNNLFKNSSKKLIKVLNAVDDGSIAPQAKNLAKEIKKITHNSNDEEKYQTYYDLSKALLDRNYTLLSLSLLFESIRLYITADIKKRFPELVKKVEKKI